MMPGINITLLTFLFFFVSDSLSFDVEPLYKPLESSNWRDSIVALTEFDDSGPTADEEYRYRRQAPTNAPPPVGPFPDIPLPTPSETFVVTDDHAYYNSTFLSQGKNYFIDLDKDNRTVTVHTALSSSHLTAGELRLPFKFPFYGHNISKVYVATGGFLSLSTFFHQYLSATQYIAPLMGNFDPSLNGSSRIRYAQNSTTFTVEWDDLHIQHIQDVGRFTFQATLMSDGRILFAYKTVPTDVNSIGGGNGHKVTVGLSDGYYIDEPLYPGSYLVKRTIYHYHDVYLNKTLVATDSAYLLTPLRTCNLLSNCRECLSEREAIRFDCGWCGELGRCSDGLDRHRQEWIEEGCPEDSQEGCSNPASGVTAAIVILIVIIVVIMLMGFGCFVYAYKNPSSRSGQQLIVIQQRLRRGVRRNPQDNYQESIVGNMQESKSTAPPAYTPPDHDSPSIPTPPMASSPPVAGVGVAGGPPAEIPVVITTGGTPGAKMTNNGDAPHQEKVDMSPPDGNASMSDC